MNTSLKVNKLVILIVLIPFFATSKEQQLRNKKSNNFYNQLVLDFSASYVSLNSKPNETQLTYRELILEEKLNQGIQYSMNLYYELENNLLLGLRYSLMEGEHQKAKLLYEGFLVNVSAQDKIHFLGPAIAYRKFSNDLKLNYEVSYSMGFTSSIRIYTVQNSTLKYIANTFGSEFGLAIYYKITKQLALGAYTGINYSSFKEYRIESSNGVSHEKFDDNGSSSLDRGYYGISLRIKKQSK